MRLSLSRYLCVCAIALLPIASNAAGSDADRQLGPLKLTRPLAPETIERMFNEAEDAYRARRWVQATEAFNAIVAFEPDHAKAWLRLGNLHQRRNQLLPAASAYRKAAQRRTEHSTDDDTRIKALLNLASVNIELAQLALAEVDDPPRELVDTHDQVSDAAQRVKSQIESRERVQTRGAAAEAGANTRAQRRTGPAPMAGPVLVPTHTAGAAAGNALRPTVGVVPSTSSRSTPGARPDIEYLQGAPSP